MSEITSTLLLVVDLPNYKFIGIVKHSLLVLNNLWLYILRIYYFFLLKRALSKLIYFLFINVSNLMALKVNGITCHLPDHIKQTIAVPIYFLVACE